MINYMMTTNIYLIIEKISLMTHVAIGKAFGANFNKHLYFGELFSSVPKSNQWKLVEKSNFHIL